MMKIVKVGIKVILGFTILFWAIIAISWFAIPCEYRLASVIITIVSLILNLFVVYFFRLPERIPVVDDDGAVYAPADGQVVVVEPVYEEEYFKCEMIQISIFMSLTNVHANFFPISGTIEYFKHHQGSFLVAWHPKSSKENERTTVVVRLDNGEKILFRQIAGFIARRIVSDISVGEKVQRGKQCGFIKFGSRVDIFLPLGSNVLVDIEDSTVGSQTKIAQLPICK